VKQNLPLMIFGIILLSLMPGIVGYLRQRRTQPR
jgi:type II secretory pathway pseudopilin PulG